MQQANFPPNKFEHPCFPQPGLTTIKVWRYMDISNLIHIIAKNTLHLSRIDLLEDPFEGSITKLNYLIRENQFQQMENVAFLEKISEVYRKNRKSMFVSCWRADNNESEAMWKLYCPSNKGIALQTTYKKLADSISHDPFLYIGLVTYMDYNTEAFNANNMFYPVMHKRKSFDHEREIRLVKTESKYWGDSAENSPEGIDVSWDITTCVEKIFVNPYASNWYFEVVKELLSKFKLQIEVDWSGIRSVPYF